MKKWLSKFNKKGKSGVTFVDRFIVVFAIFVILTSFMVLVAQAAIMMNS